MRSHTRALQSQINEEKVMSQTQQYKKVKLYRTLKVVFYMLGLPLFLVAVCFTAVRFIGHDPFMGDTTFTTGLGFFKQAESYITAPALYGVWIGFGVWAFISIVHIVLSKTVKNPRVRMFSVVAVCMAVMLLTGVVMDVALEKQVTALQEQYAGTDVVVNDYKTQLSYYRTVSSNAVKKNDTLNLIAQVDLLKNAYNVEMEGADKSGVAGNISNKPVTYFSVISDDGKQGVDISFRAQTVKKDGKDVKTGLYELDVDETKGNTIKGDDKDLLRDHKNNFKDAFNEKYNEVAEGEKGYNPYAYKQSPEYNQIIRLKPNGEGKLVINGTVYSHYFYKMKTTKAGEDIYVWYARDLAPDTLDDSDLTAVTFPTRDGIYGTGIYNSNGMLSDGWVFSLDNVLNILDDYYSAQEDIEKNGYDKQFAKVYAAALQAREDYYTGKIADPETKEKCPEWLQALYQQEIDFADNFSLTRNGLDYLIAKVGALLGNNHLFDFLLKTGDENGVDQVIGKLPESFGLGAILGPILTTLQKGASFKGAPFNMTDETLTTVLEWVKPLLGVNVDTEIHDLYLMVTYAGAEDGWGNVRDGLYVALVKDGGPVTDEAGNVTYPMGTDQRKADEGGDVLVDIDFTDAFVQVGDDGNVEYNFDLDHLSTFLNTALNGLMTKLGTTMPDIMNGTAPGIAGTIGTVLKLFIKEMDVDGNTYYGLTISGIKIPLLDSTKNFAIDVSGILTGLLDGLYFYQSPAIKPVWEFYTWKATKSTLAAAEAYEKYERANYEATAFGSMIGSTLVGDTIGAGTYPSALGLTSLTAVRQLKADLSYKPKFYPLYGVRDMLFFFCGIVVLFYFLSFVAQEKELEYANGTVVAEEKRAKKAKKAQKADFEVDFAENGQNEVVQDEETVQNAGEDLQIPVDENSDKEVL